MNKKTLCFLVILSCAFLLKIAVGSNFKRENYFGKPVYDNRRLSMVLENDRQLPNYEDFVYVRVTGIKVRPIKKEFGRIRVAVWDHKANYAKEKLAPYKAVSHLAKDALGGEMLFKISVEKGKSYSFFAHFDKNNSGTVKKLFGIPLEPYVFSNKENQGKGRGLKREGFGPPKFENTLVKYLKSGQEIILTF